MVRSEGAVSSRARTPSPVRRHRIVLGALACLLGLLVAAPAFGQTDGPLIDVVEVERPIDGQVTRFVTDTMDRAADEGAEVVVLSLDSPGAMGDAGLELADAIDASPVPVVVWVGPSGAQATGASALVAGSAHLLAMAPSTSIGGATDLDLRQEPSSGDPEVGASILAERAEQHGRNGAEAASWATENRVVVLSADPAITDLPDDVRLPRGVAREQISVVPEADLLAGGVADLVGARLDDVLRELDGREVVVDGATRALDVDTELARVRFTNLGLGRQFLTAAADPLLAYVLVMGGLLCIGFELFQPGFGVAGISGGIIAALGAYGLVVLPTRWWAAALLLAGFALLAADLALSRLGALSLLGTVALGVGSAFLMGGSEVLAITPWAWVPSVAFTAVFFVIIMTTVLKNQGNQAFTGAQGVIGETAIVRSMLNPEGHVFVGGQLWRARAPEEAGRVKTGTAVRVLGLNDNLSLQVEILGGAEAAKAADEAAAAQAADRN